MVVACSFFSLILGLFIWFDTLQTRKNLSIIWSEQPMAVQSLLQTRVSSPSAGESSLTRPVPMRLSSLP